MDLEFPRLVYKSASNHMLVRDMDAYDAALTDGWFGTVPEALAPKIGQTAAVVTASPDDAPPTREELEAKATELGISFTARSKDETIAKAIAEKLAA